MKNEKRKKNLKMSSLNIWSSEYYRVLSWTGGPWDEITWRAFYNFQPLSPSIFVKNDLGSMKQEESAYVFLFSLLFNSILNILHYLQNTNTREVGINTRLTRMYQCVLYLVMAERVTSGSPERALVETHCRTVFLEQNTLRVEPRDQRARLLVLHCWLS